MQQIRIWEEKTSLQKICYGVTIPNVGIPATVTRLKGVHMADQKERYIEEIMELLEKCNDIDLLDLIFKILCKSA